MKKGREFIAVSEYLGPAPRKLPWQRFHFKGFVAGTHIKEIWVGMRCQSHAIIKKEDYILHLRTIQVTKQIIFCSCLELREITESVLE